jgi:hypothetical protein
LTGTFVTLFRQFSGKRMAVMMRSEGDGGQKHNTHVIFLLNFAGERRRRLPDTGSDRLVEQDAARWFQLLQEIEIHGVPG